MQVQVSAQNSIDVVQTGGLWDSLLSTDPVELSIRAREPLFFEGDDADFVYEILSGTVCSYALLPDGRRQVTGFSFAGDIVGLSDQDTHCTSCDAVGAARVRSIPRSRLWKTAEERPELSIKLLECAAGQLANMQQHFVILGRKSAVEKLASFLLTLARRFGGEDADEVTITLPMTRADIADYLGLTIETVSRTFTKLRAAGVIDLPQNNLVHVRDMLKLEDVATAMDEGF